MKKLFVGRSVLASLALAAALAGCGAGDDTSPRADSSSSESSTTEPTTVPATEPTTEPTSEPTVDPNAATGKLVELDGVSFRLPEDYRVSRNTNGRIFEAERPDSLVGDPIGVSIVDSVGSVFSLKQLIKTHNKGSLYLTDPVTYPPVMIDGEKWFHVEGKVRTFAWSAAYGFNNAEYDITISFEFSTEVPLAERHKIVDSVVATVDLT